MKYALPTALTVLIFSLNWLIPWWVVGGLFAVMLTATPFIAALWMNADAYNREPAWHNDAYFYLPIAGLLQSFVWGVFG